MSKMLLLAEQAPRIFYTSIRQRVILLRVCRPEQNWVICRVLLEGSSWRPCRDTLVRMTPRPHILVRPLGPIRAVLESARFARDRPSPTSAALTRIHLPRSSTENKKGALPKWERPFSIFWWRRRELNPRPPIVFRQIFTCLGPSTDLASRRPDGQGDNGDPDWF